MASTENGKLVSRVGGIRDTHGEWVAIIRGLTLIELSQYRAILTAQYREVNAGRARFVESAPIYKHLTGRLRVIIGKVTQIDEMMTLTMDTSRQFLVDEVNPDDIPF